MSAILGAGLGWATLSTAPLAFRPPRGLAARLKVLGLAATARLRLKALRFLEALQSKYRKRRSGDGGPGDPLGPDRNSTPWSYCEEPALWVLTMMH
jgi:hypothetical protein